MKSSHALLWTTLFLSMTSPAANALEISSEQRSIQQWVHQAGGHISDEALPLLNAERTELELDVRAGELGGRRLDLSVEATKGAASLRMGTLFFVFNAESSSRTHKSGYTCIQGADLIHDAWTADESFVPDIEVDQFLRTDHDAAIDFFGQTERPSICIETGSPSEKEQLESQLLRPGCTLSFDVSRSRKIELSRKDPSVTWKVRSTGLWSATLNAHAKIDRAIERRNLQLQCSKDLEK
jgi:hypothetical protein